MKNFQAIATFDPQPLLHQIWRQELWKKDTYLRDYPQGPFEDVETIFLRFPTASVNELEQSKKDQHECEWMDGSIHLPGARPILFSLMSKVEGERLGRCMINKLRPGGRIFPHKDTPAHAQYWERYHCVLQSKVGCNFRCDDEQIFMQPGVVYWFDHRKEHEVVNNSDTDRINLVVDIRTSKFNFAGLKTTTVQP
jgi:Aspartyl/Asparaginyl beta-hydroxylase